jgi:hypothetical protein
MSMSHTRRPAGDLIHAIVENMRANLETLRYSTVAPSHYTVYLSPREHARLEGLIPRLRAETVRALDEEMARLNRGSRLRRPLARWLKGPRPHESADMHWHIEFLPDLDDDLKDDQDIIVQSDLVLPAEPELGGGERTRRVRTRHMGSATTKTDVRASTTTPAAETAAFGRLVYADRQGPHRHDIVRDSTTIGRGGTMYPVEVRVATSDHVSREHARIRRDPASGALFLIDLSTLGTTLDGKLVPRGFDESDGRKRENGVEVALPRRARIGLADTVYLDFEALP